VVEALVAAAMSLITAKEVLDSRMSCPPLNLFMLCSADEGAIAVILKRSGGGVRLVGISLQSHLPGSIPGGDSPLCGIDDATIVPPELAARNAYSQVGLGPDDLDVVECQDTDAACELLDWAALGLCTPGGQAAVLAAGDAGVGGRPTLNPSDERLIKSELLGASALGRVVEEVRLLR
jgi:acetyl-CoA acetyltransferase